MINKLSPDEIRRHKGVSFPGVTTVFLCHDGKGNIFMQKRSQKARDEHGRWEGGAGGLRHGQSAEDNVRREIQEEYGVVPTKLEFIGYYDAFRENEFGQTTHWLALLFAAQVDRTKVRVCEPEMVEDAGWFHIDQLPTPIHSQLPLYMQKFGPEFRRAVGATAEG